MDGQRNDTIDAFRGIAILAVAAFHYLFRWAPPASARNLYGYANSYPHWLDYGKYGVHLFFVISGLVITMTVLRSKSVWDFVARRAARLWPAMILAATVTFAVSSYAAEPEFKRTFADYLASLTFDPADLHRAGIDGSYWSLGIEVKFYAVVALGFIAMRERFYLIVAGVAALSGFGALIHHGQNLLFAEYWPYFIAGISGWYWLFERRIFPAIFLGIESGVLFAISNPGPTSSLLLIGAIAGMFGLIRIGARLPILPAIGRISYSFYLLHQVLGVLLIQWLVRQGTPDLLAAGLTVVSMMVISAISFELVEQPGARIIRRLGKARLSQLSPITAR